MSAPGRSRVDDVTAVVLADSTTPDLTHLLDTLAEQSRLPQRLVVTGVDPEGELAAQARAHRLGTELRVPVLVRDDPPGPLGLEGVRRALPVHPDHWLWVLAADTFPVGDALAALSAAARRSSRVGVVGAKHVDADDPRLLVAVGHHLTVAGRPADLRSPGLVDQGQLDLRQDVLGVPLAGALVRSDVLEEIGGVDAAFAGDGLAGLDLSWRTHLAGHRVVVAPDAVVVQGGAGLGLTDPRRTRVRQRQLALARGSAWSAPFRALGVLVTSTLATLLLLLVKRPREAADEWADVRAVLAPARGLGARWRFRRRRRVRTGDLAGLFAPAGTGWRTVLDTVGEALDPRGARPLGRRAGGPESGPVSEEFAELDGSARRGWFSWPLLLAGALLVALSGWRWRELLDALGPSAAGVVGPQLGPAPTDAAGLWHSALDVWRGSGLGHGGAAEPWLLPLAGTTGLVQLLGGDAGSAAGLALAWTLVAAPVLALLTAYVALRRSTRRRWLRAGLALGWAGLLPLTEAIGQGRVGPVVVHVLAPLLAAGFAVAASRQPGTRRTAATFATVLGAALAARWVPLVLLPTTALGLLLLVLGRGSGRWRGAVLALLPWPLLGPWLREAAAHPVRLLGGAGATTLGAPPVPPAWQSLLLATAPTPLRTLAALPLLAAAVLWLLALGALLLRGRAGRRAGVLVTGAGIALLAALVVSRSGGSLGGLPAGYDRAGAPLGLWDGTLLSLVAAPLLLAAGLLLDRLPGRRSGARGWVARTGAGALTVLAGAAATAFALLPHASLLRGTGLQALRPAPATLPAVAAEQAVGPSAQRTLTLVPEPTTAPRTTALAVDLRGAEPEPATILPDRVHDLLAAPTTDPRIGDAVAALTGQQAGADARARLLDLGVGYLLLRAPAEHPLVATLDRTPGLTRVSSPPGQVLWRLADNQAARARVVGGSGETRQRVEVTGPHGRLDARLRDLPAGTRLVVAEGDGWARAARASVDGRPADVSVDGVALPAGDHRVHVDVPVRDLWWQLATAALALVVAFLALPFGRAEHPGATRTEEER